MVSSAQGPDWYLRNGDSFAWLPTLGDRSVDHTISDPPFTEEVDVGFATMKKPGKRGGAKHPGRLEGKQRPAKVTVKDIGVGALSTDDVTALCAQLCRVTRRWIVLFCAWEQISAYKRGLELAGGEYVRACAWDKPDSTPQLSGDGPATWGECIVVGHAPRAAGEGRRRWNAGGKRGKYTAMVCRGAERTEHPTQKPHRLMVELVDDFTERGEVLLDPFAGVGSMLLAATHRRRRALGSEWNPTPNVDTGELEPAKWFDVAVRRLRGEEAHPSNEQPSLFGAVT
jgi:DNA modification methylase